MLSVNNADDLRLEADFRIVTSAGFFSSKLAPTTWPMMAHGHLQSCLARNSSVSCCSAFKSMYYFVACLASSVNVCKDPTNVLLWDASHCWKGCGLDAVFFGVNLRWGKYELCKTLLGQVKLLMKEVCFSFVKLQKT